MNHIIMNHNCRYHKAFIFYGRSIRGFQSYKLKANVFVHHRLLFYDLNKKKQKRSLLSAIHWRNMLELIYLQRVGYERPLNFMKIYDCSTREVLVTCLLFSKYENPYNRMNASNIVV